MKSRALGRAVTCSLSVFLIALSTMMLQTLLAIPAPGQSVLTNPQASQSVIQPSNTTLYVNSLNFVVNADQQPGSDFGMKVNAAIAALPLMYLSQPKDTPQHCGIVQIPNDYYVSSTTIIKPNCVTIEGNGAQIFYNGKGIAIAEAGLPTYTTANVTGGINNLWLSGGGTQTAAPTTSNGYVGILIGADPSGQATPASYSAYSQNNYNVHVEGFRVGVMLGSYSSLDSFHGGTIEDNGVGVWAPGNTVGAGEEYDFFGTTINNNFTLGIQNDLGAEIKMFGGSIDYTGGVPGQPFYTGNALAVSGSNVVFDGYGTHIEQYNGPFVDITNGTLTMSGGVLYASAGSSAPATSFINENGIGNLNLSGLGFNSGHNMTSLINWQGNSNAGSISLHQPQLSGSISASTPVLSGEISNIKSWDVEVSSQWQSPTGVLSFNGFQATGYPSNLNNLGEGLFSGWNYPIGSGSSVLFNNPGSGGPGGFVFYEVIGGSPQQAASITGDGVVLGQNGVGIGSSNARWTTGSGAPPTGSSACTVTGSLYSNTNGTSGSTLWTCIQGTWIAVK